VGGAVGQQVALSVAACVLRRCCHNAWQPSPAP
jgi:hypothetical protein